MQMKKAAATPARFTAALLVAAFFSGCGESTSPPEPASVTPDATVADGTAGLVLTTPPTFTVKDAGGNALGGVDVTVTVTAGGGTLTDAPTETRSGATPIGTWKLGNIAGVNSVTVTVPGLSPIVISVNGRAGPPASIAFTGGAGQSALAGASVSVAPTAQVRDQFGNGVSGVAVLFAVADGEGAVAGANVTTDAAGNAVSPTWTLGKSAVPQTLRASAGAFATTLSATVATSYNVEVRFFGPQLPAAAANAFLAAAARIRGAVVGDLPDIATPPAGIDLTQCGVAGVTLSETVDDLIVYASVAPIDGPGRILAGAGPCFVRVPGDQSIIGVMRFDSDDIQPLIDNGRLRDVIQHEMLHVVGVGTLWSRFGLIQGAGTVDSRYTGALGIGACITLGGGAVCAGSVPVENQGGPGTADGHWRESVFATELMTGFIGGNNPFSTITIQSLGDMGYAINTGSSDIYTVPGASASALLGHVLGDRANGWEILEKPRFMISRTGRVTALPSL